MAPKYTTPQEKFVKDNWKWVNIAEWKNHRN
jgi:hypothetical protein